MDYGIREAVDRLITGRLSTAQDLMREMTSCAGVGTFSKPMGMITPKKVKGAPLDDEDEVDEAKVYNDFIERQIVHTLEHEFKFTDRDQEPHIQPDGSYDYVWTRAFEDSHITVTVPILKESPYAWKLVERKVRPGQYGKLFDTVKTLEGQTVQDLRSVLKFILHQDDVDEQEQDMRGYSLSSYSGGNSTVGYKEIGRASPTTGANLRSWLNKEHEKSQKARKTRIHNMKFVATKPLTFTGGDPDGTQTG
jgi:hypothetical protein